MLYSGGLFDDFPFIEKVFEVSLPVGELNSVLGYELDPSRVKKHISAIRHYPNWCDINEIKSAGDHLVQLDLLGHSSSPVLFIKSEYAELIYLIILKPYNNSQDIFYGDNQKLLIELCLKERLSNNANNLVVDKMSHENYIQVCKNQIDKINYLNNELSDLKLSIKNIYLNLTSHILNGLIDKNETLSLSDNTIEYLIDANYEYPKLESMLKDAYKIAKSVSSTPTNTRISKEYFQIRDSNKSNILIQPNPMPEILNSKPISKSILTTQSTKPKSSTEKLDKTIAILDRYEKAVAELIHSKIPVMGKNIAQACIPQISAPALTDSINKHKDRIIDCMKLYPGKWTLLRNNYQPIQKLLF